jgi:hypothetical protein
LLALPRIVEPPELLTIPGPLVRGAVIGLRRGALSAKWPFASTGSSMKIKGANIMLSKKHYKVGSILLRIRIGRSITSRISGGIPGNFVFLT